MERLRLGIYIGAALVGAATIFITPEVLPAAHCILHCEVCRCSPAIGLCDCDDCTLTCEPS